MTAYLPYAGTSGWSGTDTSQDRAHLADSDGTTRSRQTQVIVHLANRAEQGLTWKELASLTGMHHGTASGVLSVLHKVGAIARLTERRSRCKVYVLPAWIMGRPTEAHGRSSATHGTACPICGYEQEVGE